MLDEADQIPPGPKMAALNERQRNFVMALYHEDAPLKGDGLLLYAVRTAGYGKPESTNAALSVQASRLVSDEKVQAAIAEYSRGLVRAISPDAVRAVREAIRSPKHKDHIRAAAMVLDRIDPVETTHTLRVEDYRPPSVQATEKVVARILELAKRAGMSSLPPPIDVEFTVVGTEGTS